MLPSVYLCYLARSHAIASLIEFLWFSFINFGTVAGQWCKIRDCPAIFGTVGNYALYNETFTGRARPIKRCTLCTSEHHTEAECPETPFSRAQAEGYGGKQQPTRLPSSAHLCQLFNSKYGNKCHYNPCRFSHKCTECRGSHPVATSNRGRPPAKMSRPNSPRFRGRK